MKHDAIVVTSGSKEHAQLALDEARKLNLATTSIETSHINGYSSFLIIPDGSKEFWKDSDDADESRRQWKEWASQQKEKSVWIDWVHVRFGGDDKANVSIQE